MPLWNDLSSHLRRRFGRKVQKIPLDAGATCPNRDGTLSHSGCTFCNEVGSGSGLRSQGLNIAAQWNHWRAHFLNTGRAALFLAYLQSFSNTYGPAERLRGLLEELRGLPDLVGCSVGTRPDCLDAEKAALLADAPGSENWVELGVQTFNDATLRRINRGHDAACSERAVRLIARAGVQVCAHLIAGLPGETGQDFLASVRRLNDLPAAGVKFHNLFVCRNTPLEHELRQGLYRPLEQQAYVDLVTEALELLRSDLVVHRVVADPTAQELIAPEWSLHKHAVVLAVEKNIRSRNPDLAKGAARRRRLAERRAARAREEEGRPFTVRRPES